MGWFEPCIYLLSIALERLVHMSLLYCFKCRVAEGRGSVWDSLRINIWIGNEMSMQNVPVLIYRHPFGVFS